MASFCVNCGGTGNVGVSGQPIVCPVCDDPVKQRRATDSPVDKHVDHPSHYGGKDNPYEAIKVIEAWALGFNLGNTVKYIARNGKKGDSIECLKKARWYLDREITNRLAAEKGAERASS